MGRGETTPTSAEPKAPKAPPLSGDLVTKAPERGDTQQIARAVVRMVMVTAMETTARAMMA